MKISEIYWLGFGILLASVLAGYAAWLLAGAVTAGPIDAGGLLPELKRRRVVWACLVLFFELLTIFGGVVGLLRLRRRFRWRVGVAVLPVAGTLGIASALAGIGGWAYSMAMGYWQTLSTCVREAGSVAALEQRFGPARDYWVVDDRNLDWVINVANWSDREFAKGKEVYFFAVSAWPCYWLVIWCQDGKIVKKTWSPM